MGLDDLLQAIESKRTLPWVRQAACRGLPTEIFFQQEKRTALRVCDACEVQQECFEYNREFEQRVDWNVGVYGATTPAERKYLYKQNSCSSRGNPTFSTNTEEKELRDGMGSSEV